MIREHQEERYKKLFEDKKEDKQINSKENIDNNNFNNDFKEAQKYLQSLVNKQGESVNKTMKNYTNQSLLYHPLIQPINTNLTDVTNNIINTQSSGISLNPSLNNIQPPKYGCLKNGTLPTYRNYMNQTRKNFEPSINTSINPQINGGYNTSINLEKKIEEKTQYKPQEKTEQQKITELKMNESLKRINEMKETSKTLQQLKQNLKPRKMKRKKTLRRTYKVGKSKLIPKISVLISNKTLRNNISTKSQLLKQVPMQEVKSFLIKRGLIKVGSITPNDVLRKMYESAILICGEVQNHNPDNLLYNYINDK